MAVFLMNMIACAAAVGATLQPEARLLWHLPTAQLPCESSLAVDGQDHIVVANSSRVFRISPEGKLLWSRPVSQTTDNFALTPSMTSDGACFVPGKDELAAVEPTGDVRWRAPVPSGAASFTGSPSLSSDEGLLYVGCGWNADCEAVTALNTDSGDQVWRFAPNGTYAANMHTFWAKPTVADDGTVLVCDFGGYLFALDGKSGVERWRFVEAKDPTGDYANEAWSSVALTNDGHLIFTSNLGSP